MRVKQLTLEKEKTLKSRLIEIPKPLEELSESALQKKTCISKVTTNVLRNLVSGFLEEKFEWILPVVFSTSTDPLWPDPEASIEKRVNVEIYGKHVNATLSMIIHKMVTCSLIHPRFFTLSPNIRIEKPERADSGIHAYEFTQLDFEVRDATSKDIRSLVEKILTKVIYTLKKDAAESLICLGKYDSMKIPKTPFMVFDHSQLEKEYGKSWQTQILRDITDPVWIVNIPREFYDFEDGAWDNYDLLLPNYGEVISGARREWIYSKIVRKMERDNVKKENYRLLLKLAEQGRLKPSAGAGLGIERLIAWITGVNHIGEAQLFPRVPGIVYDL
jgi:asparaginyl-tRNA synthetase